eukprot:CAMPEP_0182916576 /NCGR_PEP_ID=MMETSP0105_2-20130417/1028_1 /TAXON_ID=81532 ORGANISM="Acanthoeca-like sp., Strain 10tr" /NCGR_SAMPLE_ID=MMETSP0105_2 /ASSEMBLY_ACC=CAM_ASM_000205 /LENGTH=60 /DNA_ID=CAMNT_0025053541 /DNA_START=36 /DNA_END=218 /DNA_ORIENTATION=+
MASISAGGRALTPFGNFKAAASTRGVFTGISFSVTFPGIPAVDIGIELVSQPDITQQYPS